MLQAGSWLFANAVTVLAISLQMAALVGMRYLLVWSVESWRRV